MDKHVGANRGAMTSTWHRKKKSDWTLVERALDLSGIATFYSLWDDPADPRIPVHPKNAPVPVFPIWRMHWAVAPKAAMPVLLHLVLNYLTGKSISANWATLLYASSFPVISVSLALWCNQTAASYGTFDGQAARDGIPDIDRGNVLREFFSLTLIRSVLGVQAFYKPDAPLFSAYSLLMIPVNVFVYAVVLDFYFYWYHRLMHEVGSLWRFHRKHHTTKHPNVALSGFADHEQELFDMLVVPALTWLTWRVDFITWWVTTCYIFYVEMVGHSGIRAYFQVPTTWPLRYLGVELCIEDHDIHHRHGWKKSGNYGKQTRLWDAVFGTMKARIECTHDNIDWNKS